MIKINPKTPTREQQLKDDPKTSLWLARLVSSLDSQDLNSLNQLIADTATLTSVLNERREQMKGDNPYIGTAIDKQDYFGAYRYLVADIYKTEKACDAVTTIVEQLEFNSPEELANEYQALSLRYANLLFAIGFSESIQESLTDFSRYLDPKLRPGVE
ncbi:hypothetical protein [Vibrio sp. 10N.239.312.D08]|uniref:hypothetical protein n=1 Tax=Vibrio sp. 10N.239.312.D08 TaxID=3229978 RepID=UPI003552A661